MATEKPLYIGFGNQKGGVGKTTLAEILASILQYEQGFNLFVVDCDRGQHSLARLREKEEEKILSTPKMAEQLADYYQKRSLRAYDVYSSSLGEAIELANIHCDKEDYDVVIFDMPGRCDTEEALMMTLDLDYLIIPVEMDRQSLFTSIVYGMAVKNARNLYPQARLKGIYFLWNKVKSSVRRDLIFEYNKRFRDELGLDVFDSCLSDLIRFRHGIHDVINLTEAFRSTYVPPRDGAKTSTGLNGLLREFLNKIINVNKVSEQ